MIYSILYIHKTSQYHYMLYRVATGYPGFTYTHVKFFYKGPRYHLYCR